MNRRHVLLVDDDELQLKLNRTRLLAAGYSVSIATCTAEALDQAVTTRPDVILSDVMMSELDGFALSSIFRCHPDLGAVPVVLLSSQVEAADRAISEASGACTIVQRTETFETELATLSRVLQADAVSGPATSAPPSASIKRMANQMAQLLAHSRSAQDRYQTLFEGASEALAVLTPDSVILEVNRRWEEIFQHAREDVVGRRFDEFAPTGHDMEFSMRPVRISGQDAVLASGRDVTERTRLEEQLRQSQKMEAVGQLTGGIAHDFNNILTVILGHGELLRGLLPEGEPARRGVDAMLEAADRAASLTKSLLAFSRRQILEPRNLDLRAVVGGVEKMLHRLIGEDITLSITQANALRRVRADAGQLEQVVMNLVVNARDAMPRGGRIAIDTVNVTFVAGGHPNLPAGDYVALTVRDTGCGMNDETKRRIFEPFFTTKELGKGTGLGLSTCYGIVKQSNGWIDVESELGSGSVFTVYLPATPATTVVADPVAPPAAPAVVSGSETILLVEDSAPLRLLVRRILSSHGYRVLEARDGREALAVAARHGADVDLVLSDVVVPGLSGPDIVARIREEGGSPRALFMSGYTDHAVLQDHSLPASLNFIQKPFVPDAIARKVREVLDAQCHEMTDLSDVMIGAPAHSIRVAEER